MKIIDNPPDNWIRHLREGNRVWLCKEQTEAIIASPFIPPEHCGGGCAGKIFIYRDGYSRIENWFIRDDGGGTTGGALMKPIEGQLPDTPVHMESSEAQSIREEIMYLKNKINKIENYLYYIFLQRP